MADPVIRVREIRFVAPETEVDCECRFENGFLVVVTEKVNARYDQVVQTAYEQLIDHLTQITVKLKDTLETWPS